MIHSAPFAAIEVRGLAKRFGAVQAVSSLDFDVALGEIFGFLGPNGAGKTTTINMLTGLARPDSGSIRICGTDCSGNPKAAQHLLGVVPDESNLYPELTGFQNLCFCAALYGMLKPAREARARDLLAQFGLAEAQDRRFAGYSRGMKRKLAIAAGIIHSPPVLFLDEPTTGIDVAGARQIRKLIADMNAAGTTIFLTTHYIEEAERLCGRIAFIVAGAIVRTEAVSSLLAQAGGRNVLLLNISNETAGHREALAASFPDLAFEAAGAGGIRVESSGRIRAGELVRFLEDRGAEVEEARIVRPSLEDVFVRVTGIEASAMKQDRPKSPAGGGGGS